MSGYKGQRGPNVSQYIANLNQLSPQLESLNDPLPADNDDFSAFLNNDFFDVNGPVNFDPALDLDVDLPAESSASPNFGNSSRKHSISTAAEPNMDFNLNGRYSILLCCRICTCLLVSRPLVLAAVVVYCVQYGVQ